MVSDLVHHKRKTSWNMEDDMEIGFVRGFIGILCGNRTHPAVFIDTKGLFENEAVKDSTIVPSAHANTFAILNPKP